MAYLEISDKIGLVMKFGVTWSLDRKPLESLNKRRITLLSYFASLNGGSRGTPTTVLVSIYSIFAPAIVYEAGRILFFWHMAKQSLD